MTQITTKSYDELTFSDNFMFYKILTTNLEVCRELIEILLGIEIKKVELASGEQVIDVDYYSKGIRLDVYAKADDKIINLEMQRIDTKFLEKRARYYQSVIDVDNLKTGEPYENLPESYIIFICLTDIFGDGLPAYHFENVCQENPGRKLEDKTYKIFFNANSYDKIKDVKLRAFLKYLTDNIPQDSFTQNLTNLISDAQRRPIWRKEYMTFEMELNCARYAGREEGMKQKAIENALMLIKKYKAAPEDAAKDAGAPLELVLEALRNSN